MHRNVFRKRLREEVGGAAKRALAYPKCQLMRLISFTTTVPTR
jgi:hypothetical protein